jgi:hypothetical protein
MTRPHPSCIVSAFCHREEILAEYRIGAAADCGVRPVYCTAVHGVSAADLIERCCRSDWDAVPVMND